MLVTVFADVDKHPQFFKLGSTINITIEYFGYSVGDIAILAT